MSPREYVVRNRLGRRDTRRRVLPARVDGYLAMTARHVINRFWALVDSESVKLFVWPYYAAMLAWGIYGTFLAAPIEVVDPVMGHWIYNLWVWLCIAGPVSVMIGLILGSICGHLSRRSQRCAREKGEYVGLWMQLGGNVCAGFILSAFEFSVVTAPDPDEFGFVALILAPYILGCGFLALTVARKLWLIERLQQQLGADQ